MESRDGDYIESKYQALVAGDSRVDSKGKKKANKPPEQKRDKNKSQEDPQGSVMPKYCHHHVIIHLTYLLALNPSFSSGNSKIPSDYLKASRHSTSLQE